MNSWDFNRCYNEFYKNLPYDVKIDKDRNKKEDSKNMSYKIKDYKIIDDTVVICTFTDGTTQKAVCDPSDTFDFERAIEICVMKQVCGGSSDYNTLVSKALKDIENIQKDRRNAKKKAEEEEAIKARHLAKKIERQKKRAENARQARVDEMKEAYVAALKEIGISDIDSIINKSKKIFKKM